jgi:hypothetical protein
MRTRPPARMKASLTCARRHPRRLYMARPTPDPAVPCASGRRAGPRDGRQRRPGHCLGRRAQIAARQPRRTPRAISLITASCAMVVAWKADRPSFSMVMPLAVLRRIGSNSALVSPRSKPLLIQLL